MKVKKARHEGEHLIDWLAESGKGFKLLTDNLPSNVFIKDKNSVYLYVNSNWSKSWNKNPEDIIGKTDFDRFTTEEAEALMAEDKAILQSGEPQKSEITLLRDGKQIVRSRYKIPLKNQQGETCGILGMAWDATGIKRIQETVAQQAQEIMELSTPVMQIWEGVLVAPLIGMMDSQRTHYFMERFLQAIADTQSPVALLDITGVPAVDTQTAQYLVEAITAAKLLGARVILTGVRPAIAQTMVHLGVDMVGMDTRSSLAAGLRLCFEILGIRVGKKVKELKEG